MCTDIDIDGHIFIAVRTGGTTWCQETHPVCQLIALMPVKNTARDIKNLKKKKVQFKYCQAPMLGTNTLHKM